MNSTGSPKTRLPNMSDARSILQTHYKDASRLDARMQLHTKYGTNTQGFHAWAFAHLRLPSICMVAGER
jgi:hypothetical protein